MEGLAGGDRGAGQRGIIGDDEMAARQKALRVASALYWGTYLAVEEGLVRARHRGRQTHYTAQPRALAPLVDWMSYYSQFWHDRFDRLEDLLKRMDP